MRAQTKEDNEISRRLYSNLEQIRKALSYSHDDWADTLCLTRKQYSKYLVTKLGLPLRSLVQASESLQISLDLFFNSKIDLKALRAHKSGNKIYVPERYLEAAFSKRRTVVNAVSFLDNAHYGLALEESLLKKFQLTPEALEDLDAPINIRFISEMWTFLSQKGLGPSDFMGIGINSVNTNHNSKLGKELKKLNSIRDVYKAMIVDFVDFYEKNCAYRLLSISDSNLVMESTTNPEVAEGLRVKHVGNVEGCHVRSGILMSTPGFINLPFAKVKKVSCVHHGDNSCKYEVNFEAAARATNPVYN